MTRQSNRQIASTTSWISTDIWAKLQKIAWLMKKDKMCHFQQNRYVEKEKSADPVWCGRTGRRACANAKNLCVGPKKLKFPGSLDGAQQQTCAASQRQAARVLCPSLHGIGTRTRPWPSDAGLAPRQHARSTCLFYSVRYHRNIAKHKFLLSFSRKVPILWLLRCVQKLFLALI